MARPFLYGHASNERFARPEGVRGGGDGSVISPPAPVGPCLFYDEEKQIVMTTTQGVVG